MELRDAAQRIFRVHRLLLCSAVVLGLLAAAAVHVKLEVRTYTSSARLSLGGTTPQSTAEAAALAGTIQGIVTSPDRIRAALDAAHINRDAVVFATKDVNTQPFSASGIMQLLVTDQSPAAAAAVANYLASSAVSVLNTQRQTGIVALEDQLRTQSDRLTATIASLTAQLGGSGLNTDQRSALLAARTDASQRLTAIATKQADVQLQAAQQAQASVVDAAVPPDRPDPSKLTLDVILGLVGGLVAGLGGAAVWETLRPTAVGRRGLEAALGAPVLGSLSGRRADRFSQMDAVTERVRHVARRSGVSTVLLWTPSPRIDLAALCEQMRATLAARSDGAARARAGAFEFAVLDEAHPPEPRQGVVVVAAPVTPVSRLDAVKDLCRDYDWPLLGGVIAKRSRRRFLAANARRVTKSEPASTDATSVSAPQVLTDAAEVAPLHVVRSMRPADTSAGQRASGQRMTRSARRAAANQRQSRVL